MAHNTFGIDFGTNNLKIYNKNEYLAALTLSRPSAKPVAIVEPEREIPGIAAIPCAKPIKILFFIRKEI